MSHEPTQLDQSQEHAIEALQHEVLNHQNPQTELNLSELSPIEDMEVFEARTGIAGALVAEVKIGKMTSIGIVDRRPYQEAHGFKSGMFWTGVVGDESTGYSSSENVYAVLLDNPQSVMISQQTGRRELPTINGRPTFTKLSDEKTHTYGRDTEVSEFLLSDITVSSRHLDIAYDKATDKVVITDRGSTNGTVVESDPAVSGERSNEQKVAHKSGSSAVKSVVETVRTPNVVGLVEQALKGEDTSLVDEENRIYGVFDGAGGHGNGDKASQIAAKVTHEYLKDQGDEMTGEEAQLLLKKAFEAANEAVMNNALGGVTTGVAAKYHLENGVQKVSWAMVGDSRIYVYNRYSNEVTQLSVDEGLGNVITNALGDNNMRVKQTGTYTPGPWDEIILCSDGITGDTEAQLLSDEEVSAAMKQGKDPQGSAQKLLDISRKPDDKTCLVVR